MALKKAWNGDNPSEQSNTSLLFFFWNPSYGGFLSVAVATF
jgi:hypothetical protein